jgi:hypothetical protein
MRSLFSIYRIRRAPTSLRELPELFLKAIVFGATFGALFVLLVSAVSNPHSLGELLKPRLMFGWAPLQGIVWTLCFSWRVDWGMDISDPGLMSIRKGS